MTQSTQTISPLRRRMIVDMRMRKLSPKTQTAYIRAVKRLAGYLGRSPDTATVEDLRHFLLHVLPRGFHRIPHYGLIANTGRRGNLARVRELLNVPPQVDEGNRTDDQPTTDSTLVEPRQPTYDCPHCGAAMIIVETLGRGQPIRAPPRLRGAA